jgi:hypothetical protein
MKRSRRKYLNKFYSKTTDKKVSTPKLVYAFPATGKTTYMQRKVEEGYNVIDTDDIVQQVLGDKKAMAYIESTTAQKNEIEFVIMSALKDGAIVVTNLWGRYNLINQIRNANIPVECFLPVSSRLTVNRVSERGGNQFEEEQVAEWLEGAAQFWYDQGYPVYYYDEDEYLSDLIE